MDSEVVALIFNRALRLSFSKVKVLFAFCFLAISGLLFVFFRTAAFQAPHFLSIGLIFLPIFICSGILFALGFFLIRIYREEMKGHEVNYKALVLEHWKVAFASSYFVLPIIGSYLILWMLLGFFLVLIEIPFLGVFFTFVPFLIHFASLLLCVFSLLFLFVVTPIVAFRDLQERVVIESAVLRLRDHYFENLRLFATALAPLGLVSALLWITALVSGSFCGSSSLQIALHSFLLMVPIAAFFAFPVVFFFNFAAESYVLIHKIIKNKK